MNNELIVLRRKYGARLLFLSDMIHGWNGLDKGQEQSSSVYVWVGSYQFKDKNGKNSKGNICFDQGMKKNQFEI